MRDSYIPLFSDTLTSSVWAYDAPTRITWFTILMLADADGYVPGSVPGIAIAANIPEDVVRAAIARFEAPDPDSRSDEHEGRRIVKVQRGWHILNFTVMRDRAKAAAERARKRAWARDNGKKGKQLPLPFPESTATSEPLDAQETGNKKLTLPSEGKSITAAPVADPGYVTYAGPMVVKKIPEDFHISPELRMEAIAMGVHPDDIERRYAELKRGPIGGSRGVFVTDLADYLRAQFPKWRTWGEQERSKALTAAQNGGAKAFSGRGAPHPTGPEPTEAQKAFAAQHGIDLPALIEELVERNYTSANYDRKELRRYLTLSLNRAKRAKEAA